MRSFRPIPVTAALSLLIFLPFQAEAFSGEQPVLHGRCSPTTIANHHHDHRHTYHSHPLLAASDDDEGIEQLEEARHQFEEMMTTTATEQTSTHVKPLTASSKRLMELELKLLEQLEDSDEVVDPLVELWTAERQDAAKELQEMELGDCSPGLVREEEQLRAMIQRYGQEWVEPMSRLAVLLFTKGRLEEAMELSRKVLEIKPWHFEAGQLLVIMLLREGHYQSALRAARSYMLPDFNDHTDSRRRKRWVREKVNQAQGLFRQALEATTLSVHGDVTDECQLDEPYCWQ